MNGDLNTIEIIGKLANTMATLRGLQSKEMEQENLMLRGALLRRELAGPSEREKFAFEQEKFAEQQRHESVKFALTTFNQLAKESSPATKSILMEHMGRLWGAMNPGEKTAARMIYDHSPLNPLEQKATWWDSTVRAPQVVADPQKDPYAFAQQLFNLDDYQQQRQNFLTGVPIQRRKVIGLNDGLFAYRGDDDKVSILNSADLALNQTAKEFNTTPGALLTQGGMYYGPEREVSIAGHTFKTRSVYNAVERKAMPAEFVPTKTAEDAARFGAIEEKLRDFSIAYGNRDDSGKTDGSKVYNLVKARLDEGKSKEWIVENVLKAFYPGYNFSFVDPGTFSAFPIWGGYSQSDTEVLTFWRGEAIGIPTRDGRQLLYYYDHSTGKVMDDQGRVLSNDLPSWSAKIGSMSKEEVVAKATGGERKSISPVKKATKVKTTSEMLAEMETLTGESALEGLRTIIEVIRKSQGEERAREIINSYQREWQKGMAR